MPAPRPNRLLRCAACEGFDDNCYECNGDGTMTREEWDEYMARIGAHDEQFNNE